jgi:hypothetical protein
MNEPYSFSFVKESVAATTPAGPPHVYYRGRCSCGWTTNMRYDSPASALTAVRRTHRHDYQSFSEYRPDG